MFRSRNEPLQATLVSARDSIERIFCVDRHKAQGVNTGDLSQAVVGGKSLLQGSLHIRAVFAGTNVIVCGFAQSGTALSRRLGQLTEQVQHQ